MTEIENNICKIRFCPRISPKNGQNLDFVEENRCIETKSDKDGTLLKRDMGLGHIFQFPENERRPNKRNQHLSDPTKNRKFE